MVYDVPSITVVVCVGAVKCVLAKILLMKKQCSGIVVCYDPEI